eukprot:GHVH01017215.1.p1 GENE.GHVH01017215.1~~GHVH01017215.1.p1  ORF type:complete len:179 (-),score=16.87 GHVH01017215.1:932-1468(-)
MKKSTFANGSLILKLRLMISTVDDCRHHVPPESMSLVVEEDDERRRVIFDEINKICQFYTPIPYLTVVPLLTLYRCLSYLPDHLRQYSHLDVLVCSQMFTIALVVLTNNERHNRYSIDVRMTVHTFLNRLRVLVKNQIGLLKQYPEGKTRPDVSIPGKDSRTVQEDYHQMTKWSTDCI